MAAKQRPDVDQLTAIATTMRDLGVVRYACNGLEVLLGPPPPSKKEQAEAEKKKSDPLAKKREHYENLLDRRVHDKELEMLP